MTQNTIIINDKKRSRMESIDSLEDLRDYLEIELEENSVIENGYPFILLYQGSKEQGFVRLGYHIYRKLRGEYLHNTESTNQHTLDLIGNIDSLLNQGFIA